MSTSHPSPHPPRHSQTANSSHPRVLLNDKPYDASHPGSAPASEGFRINFSQMSKVTVGPGSYSPNPDLLAESTPSTKFGMAHRFLNSKVGYISPRHNSDLLCTASPGPKYHIVPTSATYPRQPALSWGEKLSVEEREKKEALQTTDASDIGPAAYTPRIANIKPTAPRCAFSRSDRFGGPFGSYQTLNNSQGATMYNPHVDYDSTLPNSPRYSFGGAPHRTNVHGEIVKEVRQKPRTSFMTHSIRGGLAKPATLECNVGPGDYTPHTGDIGDAKSNGSVRSGFGSSARFLKAGLQYISAEHAKSNVGQAGPGPKYLVALNTTSARVAAPPRTTGLKGGWIP